MTTAAQRIWEAIYAAEFVRLRAPESDDGRELTADDAANIRRLATLAADDCCAQPTSRFRRRSR